MRISDWSSDVCSSDLGADRDGRVADDPFAGVVDVAAGGEVHDGVGAPADRPDHLVDLGRDVGGYGGIADVGVDLDEEVAADRHRLGFRVVDVAGDDGAARSEEPTSELQSLMRISYAVFCLKKNT